LAGDVVVMDVTPTTPLFISKGSWLANDPNVEINTQWGGFKNLFGSEGGFILRAEGAGPVVFSCYGALEVWNLGAGETISVDTGHMVAYESTVNMSIRQASGGVVQTFKSGEGLIFDFTGPGRVWTQTRNPNEFLGWIQAALGPSSGNSGGIGGLFTRS
jgi:uncharacterized protein (TIGR00266 family)